MIDRDRELCTKAASVRYMAGDRSSVDPSGGCASVASIQYWLSYSSGGPIGPA